MLSKQKRLAILVHYYQFDLEFYSIVQCIIKDEILLEEVLEQINNNYTNLHLYRAEFWNFVDGLQKITRDVYDPATGTYKVSYFNAAGQKLSDMRVIKLQANLTYSYLI